MSFFLWCIRGSLLFLGFFACQMSTSIPSPLLRVSLHQAERRNRTPLIAEATWICQKQVSLSDRQTTQPFQINYRVRRGELGGKKIQKILTLEVIPDGTNTEVANSKASATADPVTTEHDIDRTRITLVWSAARGCSKLAATQKVPIRADDKICKPLSKELPKLLTPVP